MEHPQNHPHHPTCTTNVVPVCGETPPTLPDDVPAAHQAIPVSPGRVGETLGHPTAFDQGKMTEAASHRLGECLPPPSPDASEFRTTLQKVSPRELDRAGPH